MRGKNNFLLSSNVNEVIRAVLTFFFFLQKDFTRTQGTKTHISEQKQKRQCFYVLKKHLRGKKSVICLFAFYAFYVLFVLFCVWNKKDSIFMLIKTSKKKKVVCLAFCAFYAFCAFCPFCAFCTFCACEIFL